MKHGTGSLNESQMLRLRVTCQHIDGLLGSIEDILNEPESKTVFPRYFPDLAPARRRAIEDRIERFRASLVGVLGGQGIPLALARDPASRAIAQTLVSVHISVEELRSRHMRGYGDVSGTAAKGLNGIVGELQGMATDLEGCLHWEDGMDEGLG